jgi:hypothetical protein
VGCTSKQRSLCGHTLEKCPNCKGSHIAFSSRCAKKWEATEEARQNRNIELEGRAPARADQDMATGSNRVVLSPRPQGVAEGGGDEEEMADVDNKEAAGGTRDVTMAETGTETTTRTAPDTKTEIETTALPTND